MRFHGELLLLLPAPSLQASSNPATLYRRALCVEVEIPTTLCWLFLFFFLTLFLLLASIGIYGLLAYMVGQRSREVGLRMALGARRGDVLKLFLQKGVMLAGVGIAAGVVFSASTASMMASLLYGIRSHDPAVFLVVPLLLLAVAVLASYLPARRATKISPIVALREG
jgi:putative ABC transport system permease protein